MWNSQTTSAVRHLYNLSADQRKCQGFVKTVTSTDISQVSCSRTANGRSSGFGRVLANVWSNGPRGVRYVLPWNHLEGLGRYP